MGASLRRLAEGYPLLLEVKVGFSSVPGPLE